MKQLTKIFAAAVILILAVGSVKAQEAENPLLIVSFQKIKMSDFGAANKTFNEKFGPILSGLVDEGKLQSWGLFNHAWGDEWNMNVWYVAASMEAFNTFWDEYMKRVGEQQPDAWTQLRGYIQEHKDNIYTIQNQYPLPPQ